MADHRVPSLRDERTPSLRCKDAAGTSLLSALLYALISLQPPPVRSVAPTPSSNRVTSPTNHAFVMIPRRGASAVSSDRDWRGSEAPVEYSSEDDKDDDYSGDEHAEWEDIVEPLREESFAVQFQRLSMYN